MTKVYDIGICGVLLLMIGSIRCHPIELIYNGEACECSRRIPYEIKIPANPTTKPTCHRSHRYKVEVPMQKSTCSYSFDFEVVKPTSEERCDNFPLTNLIAKIDKIVVPRKDCITRRTPSCSCGNCDFCQTRMVSPSCSCGKCGDCRKQRPCTCGLCSDCIGRDFNNFQSRYLETSEPLGYLNTIRPDRTFRQKRKAEISTKQSLPHHANKRNIGREYDIISNKASQKLDLTLPDIIQYMPETLSESFEEGKCIFCSQGVKEEKSQKRQVSLDMAPRKQATSGPSPSAVDYDFEYNYDEPELSFNSGFGRSPVLTQYPAEVNETPMVGVPLGATGDMNHFHSSQFNEPLDHVIREIIYKYPEFVEASNHGNTELTPSVDIQKEEAVQFLFKLVRGRLDQWLSFGPSRYQRNINNTTTTRF